MNIKNVWLKRFLSFALAIAMVFTMIPVSNMIADASEPDTRVADPSTKDAYRDVFDIGSDTISTDNSGRVWTDKSVYTDNSEFPEVTLKEGNESFLVSLSAMASTTSIMGMSKIPTDTMIILDMSSSMYQGTTRNPDTVQKMVDSVNSSIKKLQEDNVLNRVGVTIYYGGPNRDNGTSTAESSQVLLPLGRYTHSTDTYLKVSKSGGLITSLDVNSNVKNQAGTTVTGSHTTPDIAGTYMQLGILDAMNQFMGVQDTVVEVSNKEVTRIPVFVLMSDGEPTAATNEYTQKTVSKMGNNTTSMRSANETDFVTQLTAAYAKKMVDDHYVDAIPLFYSLSLGTSISEEVMDPANNTTDTINGYWNALVANGSVNITVMNCPGPWASPTREDTYTVSKSAGFPSNVNQRKYVDQAFTADNADDLADAFASVVEQIEYQAHYFPTLVDKNEDLEGYVSFVDRIGKYMHVSDVKGVYIDGTLYSGKELSQNFEIFIFIN